MSTIPQDQLPVLYTDRTPDGVIQQGQASISGQTTQPLLANGPIPIADQEARVAALQTANKPENKASKAGKLALAKAVDAVVEDRRKIRSWAEEVVRAHPDQALELVTALGMLRRPPELKPKPAFRITRGKGVAGTANAVVRGHRKGVVQHRATSDGGKTWPLGGATERATFRYKGFTPGTTYACQYCVVINGEPGDWSASVPYLAT